MLNLISFILCNFGVAYFITHSKLFKKLREFITTKSSFIGEYLSCPHCIGALTSIPCVYGVYRIYPDYITMAVFIFIGSITSHICYTLIKNK